MLANAAQRWPMWCNVGQCGATLANAAHRWPLRRIVGQCGATLATAAHRWPMRHNVGQSGATLANPAQPWPIWRNLGQCSATLAKVPQGWPKCLRSRIGKLIVVTALFFVISYLNPRKKYSKCDDIIKLYLPICKKFKISKTILIL
jgi:hypothetical protein